MYYKNRLYLYGGFDENFHLHNDFLEGVLEGDQVSAGKEHVLPP